MDCWRLTVIIANLVCQLFPAREGMKRSLLFKRPGLWGIREMSDCKHNTKLQETGWCTGLWVPICLNHYTQCHSGFFKEFLNCCSYLTKNNNERVTCSKKKYSASCLLNVIYIMYIAIIIHKIFIVLVPQSMMNSIPFLVVKILREKYNPVWTNMCLLPQKNKNPKLHTYNYIP
jgi:hypothetical protein